MYKQFFAGMTHTALPLFALALFLLFFAAVFVRTFALRKARDFDAAAAMPLDDSEEKQP
ncbi:MAG: CcoQ/FixQ family Cbb3-type cytochrome c oxidase assembly chaperone [Archangium gephyra]|uniref:CcoQ/FixQ family Cbb3-type cytochrome c oxidase assembly chaperone n=1 Tax=Archangium gephyra TaxID=48 RepID=A0A2W5V837_9BACT|nr:MAG: CcoQ/FixQ family Cbb3-type cytochrome c oxidase assembly chaperone [Archangium gephyra]